MSANGSIPSGIADLDNKRALVARLKRDWQRKLPRIAPELRADAGYVIDLLTGIDEDYIRFGHFGHELMLAEDGAIRAAMDVKARRVS